MGVPIVPMFKFALRMLRTTKIWNWHGAKIKIWIGAAFLFSLVITGMRRKLSKIVEFSEFNYTNSFSVIHMVQKISDNDSVCWEIDDKGFGDRYPK